MLPALDVRIYRALVECVGRWTLGQLVAKLTQVGRPVTLTFEETAESQVRGGTRLTAADKGNRTGETAPPSAHEKDQKKKSKRAEKASIFRDQKEKAKRQGQAKELEGAQRQKRKEKARVRQKQKEKDAQLTILEAEILAAEYTCVLSVAVCCFRLTLYFLGGTVIRHSLGCSHLCAGRVHLFHIVQGG